MLVLEVSVAKGLLPRHTSNHRQSVRPSTRFKRLAVWVSKAHIVAYLRLSPTDAASSGARLGQQMFHPACKTFLPCGDFALVDLNGFCGF
jgi:hypothetical protein